MNRTSRLLTLALEFALIGAAPSARAEPAPTPTVAEQRGLSTTQAVAMALARNPSYRSSDLAYRQAAARVRGEAALPWEFQADASATHTVAPTLGPNGTVVTSTNDAIAVGTELDKTFATGTGLNLRVEGDRFDTRRPAASLSGGNTSVLRGTGYDVAARATVTQPLLQGRGRDVVLSGLRTARIARTQAARARDLAASELAREVLVAYWEAWYADRTVDLDRDALALATTQRRAAEARRDAGSLAPVDVLTFAAREAELEEALVAAQASSRQRRLALDQLVGGGAAAATLTDNPPEQVNVPSESVLLASLGARSPELAERAERVRLAEAKAATATEPYRARLDLESYAEARGLGNGELGPALTQVSRLDAVSAHLGLVYRTPLDGRQRTSARTSADLDVSIARSDLEVARQRLLTATLTVASQVRAAEARYVAAQKTAEISQRLLAAERQRFDAGASTPLEVQVAEDGARQSLARVVRARVDLAEAEIELQHATGDLFARISATTPVE